MKVNNLLIVSIPSKYFSKEKKTAQYGLDAKFEGGKKWQVMHNVLVHKNLDEIQNPISCLLAVQIFCKKKSLGENWVYVLTKIWGGIAN